MSPSANPIKGAEDEGVMKYLNIQGFKAEEASRSCQQTDPLQPGHGPSLWPATTSTCRSQTNSSLSAVGTPLGKRKVFTDEIAPVSKHARSHRNTDTHRHLTPLF